MGQQRGGGGGSGGQQRAFLARHPETHQRSFGCQSMALPPSLSPTASLMSALVHAAHVQWDTHSTREMPVLTLCCSNGPCWGRREERFGVSEQEMLLPDTRVKLSTSHVRQQGGVRMREQHGAP